MTNEIVLGLIAAISLFSVLIAARLGKEYLYAAIIANLFFVSVFGAKLVEAFGFVSNIGNIFYASVFFATYVLIEHYGAEAGRKSIWLGLYTIVLFVVFSPLVGNLSGSLSGGEIDAALLALTNAFPRIAIASIFAYLLAQQLNVWTYTTLRTRFEGYKLWLRATVAMAVAQLADSVFFFALAFGGTISTAALYESFAIGFAVKVLIGLISIPLLYASLEIKRFS